MNQPLRRAQGGRIDRSQPLRFTFDRREYHGYAGDTLASALLANGVRITARSFKYHRPRGLLAAGSEEPNTLVQLGVGARTEPNLKATQVDLFDGLQARAVNCWPSARIDLVSVFACMKPLMPAGFYYKTFMWPGWHWFESFVRRAAGLGKSPDLPDPDRYDKRYETVDVLVVGAGRYGLKAAIELAERGRQVLVMDDQREPGGSLLDSEVGSEQSKELKELLSRAAQLSNLRLITSCSVFGYYDNNYLLAAERLQHTTVRQRLWHIRATEVVLATGAIERPLVFPNNDRPGVMLASAARRYLNRYGVIPGQRVTIATNNDSVYRVALELADAGVTVAAILDMRATTSSPDAAIARQRGFHVEFSSMPTGALGRRSVSGVEGHRVDSSGKVVPGAARRYSCDCLLVSGGWSPTVHLFSQSGGSVRFDQRLQAFVPDRAVQAVRSIGAANGEADLSSNPHPLGSVDVTPLGRSASTSWVDLASDVTEGDLRLALHENFGAIEHLKRYTTTGMMTDQGKTSNVNAIGIVSTLLGKSPGETGTTRFRPPYDPVTFGAIAGRNVRKFYNPLRRLPTHEHLYRAGAVLEDYGGWLRPAFVPRPGETEPTAIAREVSAVRNAVGIIDYSPLGKILVHGPDAATLLQRMYVNNMKTLKPGFCRYGVMLGEDGIVMDDGVLTRWDEHTFQVGTTSGQADRIAECLEEWLQCEWFDLDVIVEPVTTQWAVVMVAGPQARTLLQRLGADIDLSAQAFPHMTARRGVMGSVPVRIARVSFTGELSYEVSVPWRCGALLWVHLLQLGADLGVTPFGIESLMVMRIEKGFLHVGTDTDGATMPQDIGFAEIITKKTDDFIGRRSTMTAEGTRSQRRQLVGLVPQDGRTLLPVGGHVLDADGRSGALSQGWITSSVHSPTLLRPIAMGLVEGGRLRTNEVVTIFDAQQSRSVAAVIVAPSFYDTEGSRLHA